MRELRAAFPVTLPILAGYVFIGLAYGILMVTSGFPVWLPIVTAAIIYTGSMEFLLVNLLLSAFNPLTAFVTAVMVGARHLFYGLAMLKRYRGTGRAKFYLIFSTSDETFALNYNAKIPEDCDKTRYYVAISALDQSYWVVGSGIGALCGKLITFDTTGIGFVMTAMFISIFLAQWLDDSDALGRADKAVRNSRLMWEAHAPELIGVFGSAACLAVFGPDHFIIPSMVVILVVLAIFRKKLESAADILAGASAGTPQAAPEADDSPDDGDAGDFPDDGEASAAPRDGDAGGSPDDGEAVR